MSRSAYAPLRTSTEDEDVVVLASQPKHNRYSRLQWSCLFLLTAFASIVLAVRTARKVTAPTPPGGFVMINGTAVAVPTGKRRGRGKRWQYALTMGRTGTSSSFVLRTPRRSIKKQAAKAATRSVVLIGSHYGAGNELLKRVFGELVRPCPRVSVPTPCPRPPRVHIHFLPLTRFALQWWLLLLGSANARGWRCGASPRGAGSTT